MKSFLMMGQSNMAGRGHFHEVPEIQNPLCYMLRCGRWEPMHEPVNPDAPIFPVYENLHSGISLAASFADAYAAHYGEEIGLIPCAFGGTSVEEWLPGEVLYDHAVLQARLAGRTAQLAGILWHQGENDGVDAEKAAAHGERTRHVLEALRKDLGAEIPVLVGELGGFCKKCLPYFEQINDNLRDVTQRLPNCVLVSAEGLGCNEDGIHFDASSCREFGRRYFVQYRRLKEGEMVPRLTDEAADRAEKGNGR